MLTKVASDRRRKQESEAELKKPKTPPDRWDEWLFALFPSAVKAGFAEHHREFWEWVWSVRPGISPRPFFAIWPRGGGKSTGAELAAVFFGAEQVRNYAWYCCEVQTQADKHLESIAEDLESSSIEEYYPDLGERKLGKYGTPRAWRRNRLMTARGFTIDAIGLDTAVRGARVKEDRPGLIIFDDIDGKHDSPRTIDKKIEIITTSILPSGSNDVAVLGIQNLITPDSIFSQIADGRADFLFNRIVSGPIRAINGLTYTKKDKGGYKITGGTATWEGQNITICEEQINNWGLHAFLQEAQHEVAAPPGGMFDHLDFIHCNWDELPILERVAIWVDPAVTSTDKSDSMGIQADGIGVDNIIYRLWSWEQITSPEDALRRAILKAIELGADSVGVETDQGGDVWRPAYQQVCQSLINNPDYPDLIRMGQFPIFKQAKAGAGHGPKAHRAAQMLVDYEQNRIVHVRGTHEVLERALRRFPITRPLDLVDSSYWSWVDLRRKMPPLKSTEPEQFRGESRWPVTAVRGSRWKKG